MEGYINLTEEGAVTRSGRTTDTVAQDQDAQSRLHWSQVEGTEAGLRGRGGTMFRNAGELSTSNARALGEQFAREAVRAVLGEDALVNADIDAGSDQAPTVTEFEGESVTLRRSI